MQADDSRLLELIGDTYGLLDLDGFRRALLPNLRRAIGCDWVSINEVGPEPGDHWELVEPALPPEAHEIFGRYMHQNPLVAYVMESRRGTARRLSEMVTAEEFHALDLYRELYGPIGLEYQIAFTLPERPPRLLGVALSRRRRDFSEAERDLLDRARPFLIQGYRTAAAFDRLRGAIGTDALVAALRRVGLTPREADVVGLLARGRSNADLAAELGIAPRTAEKHVQNAFAKLGVRSRSQAATRAWSLAGDDAG